MREFIGHDRIISSFKKRADTGNLSHAHLIVGEDGIGKSNLARIFALKILNKEEYKDYVDIINYRPKKESFGVDEVREIIDEVSKKPFEGDKKVIIIHEGNKLTTQAQNALLKTIEEPPIGVFIILLCESLELILDTIKSRCQIYKLTPISKSELVEYIKFIKDDISEEELLASIAYSEGIPGKAERFLTDTRLKELRELILDLLKSLSKNDGEVLLSFEEKILEYKDNKEEILNILASFIRDLMVYKEVYDYSVIINGDKIEELQQLAIDMSYRKLNSLLDKIREARVNLMSNSNFAITIRVMLIGFMEV
ncbi:DNA polymerase III subunit delta' [Clostridium chauvoei]|uniref:DNA polymerase III subunit delta' n=1 Tax=Clostridium chauvoei TaxID=46867 RepID=UPI001C865891|nr:DNA polymerase III subunit delta' [Clostridium chauvoei]MBX7300654.1 DNA polymerase III subunit delta' [Clostridium chauvoei]